MKINLVGKTALICASTKGLGFACAKNLGSAGCDIILTGRSDENLVVAKKEIELFLSSINVSISIFTLRVDLNDMKNVVDMFDALKNHNPIDILILNSGGPAPGDFDSFDSIVDFEKKCSEITYPATYLIQHLLPSMRSRGFGRIINISSMGLAKPITGLAVSNASRAHLAGLMTGIANENASYGITLNTILPGVIWTDRQLLLTENDAKNLGITVEEMIERKSSSMPSGEMGKPDDVGTLATFLSSAEANYINSQCIAVDGGLLGLLR